MHIHILGICGTFMGGLAALASAAGHRVTGCDSGVYPPMSDQLRAMGIDLIEGYSADQMRFKPDLFVVGNVVSRAQLADGTPRYPLMEAILESGLPYTSGPQWLCEYVLHNGPQAHHVMAVAGTHGKTTTTAMLSWILQQAGLSPGFLIGGVPLNFGQSARLGSLAKGHSMPLFVIEADEYDTAFFDKRSKFVHYRPRTLVLNNLEFDHADIFPDLAAIERQFHHLVRTVPSSGRLVVNADQDSLARVLALGQWSQAQGFGQAMHADWQAHGEAHSFAVWHQQRQVGQVNWSLSGVHNQMNALAAIASAMHVGVPAEQAAASLGSFENVRRRMETRGAVGTGAQAITVYDDFAHHPTAIRTTLDGLRRRVGQARILAVFEPRSNTLKLGAMKSQLPWSLEAADLAFCHSGGLDWNAQETLAAMGERAHVAPNIDNLVQQITHLSRPGDHIVCMSNGGFGDVHNKLLAALHNR